MMYVFADCQLDTAQRLLQRGGTTIKLQPQVFQVLLFLLENHERVVSKQEFADHVWPEPHISDAALESCLRRVRRAIGDTGQQQRLIQTHHGYGYRFVAPVTVRTPEAVDTATDAQRCPGCQQVIPPAAEFCAVCGPEQRTPAPVTAPPTLPPSSEPWLHSHEVQEGERKLLTIMHCALVQTHAAHRDWDLDVWHRAMQHLYEVAQAAVAQYEGTLRPVTGDHFSALFGVPVAHEDHAQRAVFAALAVYRQYTTQQQAWRIPSAAGMALRIALHTGHAAVGGIGTTPRHASIVGAMAAVVTTLQERVAPGGIVCSETTARLVQQWVRLERCQPLTVVGQERPLQTYQVLGQHLPDASGEQAEGRKLSQFIGRSREMTLLHTLLQQAQTGQGQVVGIVGENGIGKSRLLYEFRRSLAGRSLGYLTGHCLPYGRDTSYLPARELLQHTCGIASDEPPAIMRTKITRSLQAANMDPGREVPYLWSLFGTDEDTGEGVARPSPEVFKARTTTALLHLWLNSSRRRPLILAVEDAQWIDASSEACFTALAERLATAAILMVVTYRPGYHPPWLSKSYATQLPLPRLTPVDSLHLVSSRLPLTQLPEPVVREMLAKAAGNPFFLEELAQAVFEQDDRSRPLTVPDTIEAVLMARIDRLAPEAKHVLQAASVVGKEISVPLLQLLSHLPAEIVQQSLAQLQAAEFLYETHLSPESVYTFKHALTQEVTYQSLLQSTRQQYHQELVQALLEHFPDTEEREPALLAHHYTAAGLHARALDYWQRAGQQALERSAYAEAIGHLSRGLSLLTTCEETTGRVSQELLLQIGLGRAYMATKGYGAPEVGDAYARARHLCRQLQQTPQLFTVLRGLATYYYMRAEYRTAHELAEQCLHLATRAGNATLTARAHLTLGQIYLFLGEYGRAHVHLTHGGSEAQPVPQGTRVVRAVQDPAVTCRALDGPTLWLLGYPEQAGRQSATALHLARELAHPFSLAEALVFAGVVCICLRHYAEVQRHAQEAMTLANEQGFPHWKAHGQVYHGWALVMQGQAPAGIPQIQQGLAAWQAIGGELARPWLLALLVEAYLHTEQIAAGLVVVDEALALAEHHGESHYLSELYRLKGALWLCHAAGPRTAEAEACLQQSLKIAKHQQARALELRTLLSRGRLWQSQGKRRDAYRLLRQCYNGFSEGLQTADLQAAHLLLHELAPRCS